MHILGRCVHEHPAHSQQHSPNGNEGRSQPAFEGGQPLGCAAHIVQSTEAGVSEVGQGGQGAERGAIGGADLLWLQLVAF